MSKSNSNNQLQCNPQGANLPTAFHPLTGAIISSPPIGEKYSPQTLRENKIPFKSPVQLPVNLRPQYPIAADYWLTGLDLHHEVNLQEAMLQEHQEAVQEAKVAQINLNAQELENADLLDDHSQQIQCKAAQDKLIRSETHSFMQTHKWIDNLTNALGIKKNDLFISIEAFDILCHAQGEIRSDGHKISLDALPLGFYIDEIVVPGQCTLAFLKQFHKKMQKASTERTSMAPWILLFQVSTSF